ncbi:MAG: SPFH domain-containing protein [Patescibacteria group bacterium]
MKRWHMIVDGLLVGAKASMKRWQIIIDGLLMGIAVFLAWWVKDSYSPFFLFEVTALVFAFGGFYMWHRHKKNPTLLDTEDQGFGFLPKIWMRFSFTIVGILFLFAIAGVFFLSGAAKVWPAIVFAVFFYGCARIIPQQYVDVVELFGIYCKTLPQGFYLIIPGIFYVKKRLYIGDRKLTLWLLGFPEGTTEEEIALQRELRRDGKDSKVEFRSQVDVADDTVGLKCELIIEVEYRRDQKSAFEATYLVDDYIHAVLSMIEDRIRTMLGGMNVDDVLAEKVAKIIDNKDDGKKEKESSLNSQICASVEAQLNEWGIKLKRFMIVDVVLSKATEEARRKRIQGRATGDARFLEADGEGRGIERLGAAEKVRRELEGEGEAARITKIRDGAGLSPEQAATLGLLERQMDAIKEGNVAVVINSGDGGGPLSIGALTAQATKVFETVKKKDPKKSKVSAAIGRVTSLIGGMMKRWKSGGTPTSGGTP